MGPITKNDFRTDLYAIDYAIDTDGHVETIGKITVYLDEKALLKSMVNNRFGMGGTGGYVYNRYVSSLYPSTCVKVENIGNTYNLVDKLQPLTTKNDTDITQLKIGENSLYGGKAFDYKGGVNPLEEERNKMDREVNSLFKKYIEEDIKMTKSMFDFPVYAVVHDNLSKIRRESNCNFNEISKVIFNDPYTIVIFADGDKVVVKCENEKFDKEKGLAMAIAKRVYGTNKNRSNYYDEIRKWILLDDKAKKEKAEKEAKRAAKKTSEEPIKKPAAKKTTTRKTTAKKTTAKKTTSKPKPKADHRNLDLSSRG